MGRVTMGLLISPFLVLLWACGGVSVAAGPMVGQCPWFGCSWLCDFCVFWFAAKLGGLCVALRFGRYLSRSAASVLLYGTAVLAKVRATC